MFFRPRPLALGCTLVLMASSAATAFDEPPQQGRQDSDTIFERAEQRADQLDDQLGVEGDQIDAVRDREQQAASTPNRPPKLPAGFERLDLSEPERAAMLRVIRQYDDQIATVVDRFGKRHAEAIGLEGIAAAAKMDRRGDMKLADAPDGSKEAGRRTAGFRPDDDADRSGEPRPDETIKRIAAESPFAGPAAATWKELHSLHLQAVELEAQKLVALERLLPKEKLDRLHEVRAGSLPADGTKSATDRPDRPDLQNANPNPEEERRDRERDRKAGASGAEAGERDDPNRSVEPRPRSDD